MRSAVDPQRLTAFFDDPNWAQASSMSRPQSTYDPSTSWDGLSVDPTPFARLDPDKRAFKTTALDPGGLFGNGAQRTRELPRSAVERDLDGDGEPDAAPRRVVRAADRAEDTLVLDEPRFQVGHLRVPQAQAVRRPSFMDQPDALLTPAQRREIVEFEARRARAEKLERQANMTKGRMLQLMRSRHPEGILGVDGPLVESSAVYGDKAKAERQRAEREGAHRARRAERLRKLHSAKEREGFDPFSHPEDRMLPADELPPVAQRLAGVPAPVNTYARLFDDRPLPLNEVRTAQIRAQELRGRDYNTITGTAPLGEGLLRPDICRAAVVSKPSNEQAPEIPGGPCTRRSSTSQRVFGFQGGGPRTPPGAHGHGKNTRRDVVHPTSRHAAQAAEPQKHVPRIQPGGRSPSSPGARGGAHGGVRRASNNASRRESTASRLFGV